MNYLHDNNTQYSENVTHHIGQNILLISGARVGCSAKFIKLIYITYQYTAVWQYLHECTCVRCVFCCVSQLSLSICMSYG